MATDKNFVIKNGLTINGSEIITSAGNLTNVGTINSGAISTTGNLDVDGIIDNTRNNGNVSAPSTSDHTAGTRIKLYDANATAFYALGIEANTMWFQSDAAYKWYEDAVERMTLSSGGNLSVDGAITGSNILTNGSRVVKLQNGAITMKGDSGGWAFGLHALGSSDTDHGGFGFLGGADAFTYYYIGETYNASTNFRFYKSGQLNVGTTTILDSSRNLTNIGTISSGAITVTSSSTSSFNGTGYVNFSTNVGGVGVNGTQGLHIGWNKSNGGREINMIFDGGTTQAETEMIFTSTDGTNYSDIFQINGGGNVDIKNGGLRIGTTTVIDNSRNLTNIGTISSGAITSTGTVTASGGNSSNWNTAYGWGNHASAGYLTSFDITTQTDSKYLRSDADDVATGLIEFTGKVEAHQFQIDRNTSNAAIWFQEGNLDQNHVLWNDYYGGPTTRGAAGAGFDGIKWNTYRGIHIRAGLAGAVDCIKVTNSSGSNTDHTVTLYASNVARLATTTSGVSVTGDQEVSGTTTYGPNPTWSKYLKIGGDANHSDANTASIGATNGNLHIDAATSFTTYLNYYDGTGGVAFGSGGTAIVAWMGPDGDLWKGGADNSGSKYWHAGNDGSGSGLDADLWDGNQFASYLNQAVLTTSSPTFNGLSTNSDITFNDSGTTLRGIRGTMGANDFWFVGGGATATNAGYMEIATGDDGQTAGSGESMFLSQYGPGSPWSGTLYRRHAMFDPNGQSVWNYQRTPTNVAGILTDSSIVINTRSGSHNYIQFRNDADDGTLAGLVFTDNNHGGSVLFENYTTSPSGASDTLHLSGYEGVDIRSGTGQADLPGNKTRVARFATAAITLDKNTSVSGSLSCTGDLSAGGDIYGKYVNAAYSNLYRFGGIYFTWDSDSYGANTHHSIRSTYGDSYSDNLTINSFNKLRINIDSNDNNTVTDEAFEIGHNTTGTGNRLFQINGNALMTLGYDGTNPLFRMEYDNNNANGDRWDTLIEIGRSNEFQINDGSYPLYEPANAGHFGMKFQGNSDAVFYGAEQYTTGNYRPVIAWGDDTSDSPFFFRYNWGTIFAFTWNGDFHADANITAYSTTTSDGRFKDNIITIENALDKVQKLRGVEFDWNATSRKGKHDIGFIAQEVEEIIPEIVTETEMLVGEFEGTGEVAKTVAYGQVTALLVEAIKEQQKQIEELKEEVLSLRSKN